MFHPVCRFALRMRNPDNRAPAQTASERMTPATRYFDLPSPFVMKRGGELANARIAYETWGELNAGRDNALLILTGLSPSAHAASSCEDPKPGWWEDIVGPAKAIDTRRFYVICVNSLGSCRGSTGAASTNPATGKVYGPDFPDLSLEDVANSAHLLVQHLGIATLRVLVGPSMGGMSAQAYGILHPGSAENLILISTAAHAEPFAIGIRSLQREAIRSDPNWNDGHYTDETYPLMGMRLARKLGVVTYRSAPEWRERFERERIPVEDRENKPFAPEFQIESYLEAHARRFAGSFDPNCYLQLSRAMDRFEVVEYGGSVRAGLSRIKARRALVIGVHSDILFPEHQQHEIAQGLQAAGVATEYQAFPSIQGHDAFLVDIPRFSSAIAQFLAQV
jgi:homoserine O-acetyltransferase